MASDNQEFVFQNERFADIGILRYNVEGFDALSPEQKRLVYYLSQAALCGRDIIYDQNNGSNLPLRWLLERVYLHHRQAEEGGKDAAEWTSFVEYLKQVWFSNGIHHHYNMSKFPARFSQEFLQRLVDQLPESGPLSLPQQLRAQVPSLLSVVLDSTVSPKRVSLDPEEDLVVASACNMYEKGITQAEVEGFYAARRAAEADKQCPVSHGLNSRLVRSADGSLSECVYRVGGLYGEAIERIVGWLRRAAEVAETGEQRRCIELLVSFYETGDLKTWDEYNIAWVSSMSHVDFTNGFVEVYGDPLGLRGSFQGMVYMTDKAVTEKFGRISKEAAWFERHSPIHEQYKRPQPVGITYNVITVIQESGDCSPSTPIGVNLPNADWIRSRHGSKSVSLGNIEHAYDMASRGGGIVAEFHTPEQAQLLIAHGELSSKIHTGLHECVGHASGQLAPGCDKAALRNYASTLEEARADLVALYYIYDQHLIDIGLIDTLDVGRAEYEGYIVNGILSQLCRIELGGVIEESHMRNRALVARWCFDKGQGDNVIEKLSADGKTYFKVNDYDKLRTLFGQLLREVQRIKSEGDYEAGRLLVETYGVTIDPALHQEVIDRFTKLNCPQFRGFINPVLVPVSSPEGELLDVKITYPDSFSDQMIFYSQTYSTLFPEFHIRTI